MARRGDSPGQKGVYVIDGLANVDVYVPIDARRFRLMMSCVPIPVVMVVVMIIAALVAGVAARQSEYNGAKKKKGTQHVFDRVLHKICLMYNLSKILPDVKRGLTGV
jgi:hypothetical protein